MSDSNQLIQELNRSLALSLPGQIPHDKLVSILAEKINTLITTDFDRLISILYRIDVSEAKLKYWLKENPSEDAAKIIAALIIERQMLKIESRKHFKRTDQPDDEEKW
ncbi:MAG: hypothetical protein JSU05_05020 [Bacteroidetes bacterium]|nr:hypothetical protein [Bacteroidota bacterium]